MEDDEIRNKFLESYNRRKVYKVAMLKCERYSRFDLGNNCFLTKDEQDAIDYFQGRGFYEKQQNPKTKPNIFDMRQSFLLKMHDDQIRNDFLNSFNYLYN